MALRHRLTCLLAQLLEWLHRRIGAASTSSAEVISIPDSDASNSDVEEDSQYAASDAESTEAFHHPDQPASSSQASNQLPFNVMLTCYTLFERDSVDQQADRSFLKKWQWSHLLLDEAHAVKNANAMRTKRLARYTTHHKWNTQELHSSCVTQ